MATGMSWWLLDEVKRDRTSFAQVADCKLSYMRATKEATFVDALHAEQFRVKFTGERIGDRKHARVL